MAASLREITNFSLVIIDLDLLASEGALRTFQNAVDGDIRHGGGISVDAATGQTQQARILNLDRDRITLHLSSARSSITREFPATNNLEAEISRFAQIVECALPVEDGPSTARHNFGFNAELVFDQDDSPTAFEFLGERLLRSERLAPPSGQFVGGACRMIFVDELGQWTYNLEPRFNDLQSSRVFISVNLHYVERPLPHGKEISDAILQMVSGAVNLMNRLGE